MSQNKTDKSEYYQTATVLNKGENSRGFGYITFEDHKKQQCSLQDSSLAAEPAIWFGVDNTGKFLTGPNGQTNEQVSARMELTKTMALQLLPYLLEFVSSEKYVKDISDKDTVGHENLLNQLMKFKEAKCDYNIGDIVKPSSEYKSEAHLRMKVLGLPVQDKYGMLWTPVTNDDDEDGISYWKSHTLELAKDTK